MEFKDQETDDLLEKTFRPVFPLKMRVTKGNPYRIPIGKTLPFARARGDGHFQIKSMWPSLFSRRTYLFFEDEVEVINEPTINL